MMKWLKERMYQLGLHYEKLDTIRAKRYSRYIIEDCKINKRINKKDKRNLRKETK